MKQWSDSDTVPGLADKTLMYRALCSLCWDSIRLCNSRACPEWDGGVRALSYGPSGAASLHSVCLILVSQLQGVAHCLRLWLTELTHYICFGVFFFVCFSPLSCTSSDFHSKVVVLSAMGCRFMLSFCPSSIQVLTFLRVSTNNKNWFHTCCYFSLSLWVFLLFCFGDPLFKNDKPPNIDSILKHLCPSVSKSFKPAFFHMASRGHLPVSCTCIEIDIQGLCPSKNVTYVGRILHRPGREGKGQNRAAVKWDGLSYDVLLLLPSNLDSRRLRHFGHPCLTVMDGRIFIFSNLFHFYRRKLRCVWCIGGWEKTTAM